MPRPDVLSRFLEASQARLQKPIADYYAVVDKYGRDSIQATIAGPLTRAEMERVLRQTHIQAGLLGSAGNITPAQQTQLANLIARDQQYLTRFMDQLPTLTREQSLVRANMYAGTAKNTVAQVEMVELPPLPVYPRSEKLICTVYCRCSLNIIYLFGSGNADIYWQLDPQGREHCLDCQKLAIKWKPLRVRDGRLLGVKSFTAHDLEHLKHALTNTRMAA